MLKKRKLVNSTILLSMANVDVCRGQENIKKHSKLRMAVVISGDRIGLKGMMVEGDFMFFVMFPNFTKRMSS